MTHPAFVLDASVTLAWFFPDEGNALADHALDVAAVEGAIVPAIWSLEVANVLLHAERRQRVAPQDVHSFVGLLLRMPIEVDAMAMTPAATFGSVADLARDHRLTAYDASYLELARRRGLPIASLDARHIAAAMELGVPQFAAR